MSKLHGRVVLVTGGQRGLGAAALKEMAAEGATCIVNYPGPIEADAAQSLVKELQSEGVEALAIAADVTDTRQIANMIGKITDRFGRLDVLVNNAGINPLKGWEELDSETFDQTLNVNMTGVFNSCRAVFDIMREQKKGSIINIASVAAFIGRGNVDYISSKAALLGLTRSLARQYGKYGIRANCVFP